MEYFSHGAGTRLFNGCFFMKTSKACHSHEVGIVILLSVIFCIEWRKFHGYPGSVLLICSWNMEFIEQIIDFYFVTLNRWQISFETVYVCNEALSVCFLFFKNFLVVVYQTNAGSRVYT
jgi:hypothetical protein